MEYVEATSAHTKHAAQLQYPIFTDEIICAETIM